MSEAAVLGEDDRQIILDSRDDFLQHTDLMLSQARRSLRVHAPDMDPQLLNRAEPLALCRRLTRHPLCSARLLIHDSDQAKKNGHGFIDMAQRFPSFIEIRILSAEDRSRQDAWLIADDTGLVYRPHYQRLAAGHACFHDVSLAAKLARDFDEWWERAAPDTELRRLYL
jgi:hypothetical protein